MEAGPMVNKDELFAGASRASCKEQATRYASFKITEVCTVSKGNYAGPGEGFALEKKRKFSLSLSLSISFSLAVSICAR